jgi:glycine/D-amino acid oxidase-like deaminating enzyme
MIAHGMAPSVGELIIGAGLIGLGTAAHANERLR